MRPLIKPWHFVGYKLGQTDTKITVTFGVKKKVTATFKDPVTFWGYKLDQTDHKGHRDLWGHQVGHGDL